MGTTSLQSLMQTKSEGSDLPRIFQKRETKIRLSDSWSTSRKNLEPFWKKERREGKEGGREGRGKRWAYCVSHQVIAEDAFNSHCCTVYSSFSAYLTNPVRWSGLAGFFPYFIHEEMGSERRMTLILLTQQFLRENDVMERTLLLESRIESEICQTKGGKPLGQSLYSSPPLSAVSLSVVSVTWSQLWSENIKWRFQK